MGRSPTNTKEKLLETAMDLIWKSSYGSVSVDDICNAANVRKGSFYYYFPSKAELAIAAMEAAYQHYEPELANVFSASIPPAERFDRLATFIYEKQKFIKELYGRVCGCPFASLGSEMAGNEDAICQKAEEIFHRQESFFIRALQEMVVAGQIHEKTDLAAKAAQIRTYIMGLVMMARIQNNLTVLQREIKPGLIRIINAQESLTTLAVNADRQAGS